MTAIAQLLIDANAAAADRVALNDEPAAYHDRFGDNLGTIASGIAGRR